MTQNKEKKQLLPNNLVQLAIVAGGVIAYCYCNKDHKPSHNDCDVLKKGEKFYYMITNPEGVPTQQNSPTGPNLLIGNNKEDAQGQEIPNSSNTLFTSIRFLSNSTWTRQAPLKGSIFFTTLP